MTEIVDGWFTGPGIIRKPLSVDKDRKPMGTIRRMNCHIAVTEVSSLLRQFNQVGASDSHTYVRRGTAAQIVDPNGMSDMEQYVPITMCANADWQGNDATVSSETQGGVGDDAENGQWDPAQVRRLRWMWKQVREYANLPNKLVSSSRLGSDDNKGLGWHRIGIDGNYPQGELGGRLQRGASTTEFQVWNPTLNRLTDSRFMHWSKHFGKSCPGRERIKQMPSLLIVDTPLPTPVVEDELMEENMKMILRLATGPAALVWGNKAFGINNGSDLAALNGAVTVQNEDGTTTVVSEDIPVAVVSQTFWDKMLSNLEAHL